MKTKRPSSLVRKPRERWTEDDTKNLITLGNAIEGCYIGECKDAWETIGRALGRTANACHTRYSKLKYGRIAL